MSFNTLLSVVLWGVIVLNVVLFWGNLRQWRHLSKIRQAEFEIMIMMWRLRYQLSAEAVHRMRTIAEFEAFKGATSEDG